MHGEAVRRAHYDDQGNNCTYGVGTLVHFGPCTATEMAAPVTDAMVERSLDGSLAVAERQVRNAVTGHDLTQEQFDAAVSFVYSTGHRGLSALRPANEGDMAGVASRMRGFVHVCQRDRSGRIVPGRCRISAGLVNRRNREAAPFDGGRP
ncbi:hypothetical protein ASG87_00660 [Frateuria sp. Soil773]|nr:hypothetical protein ASG87_00660 [Frateuria sp. Soil773]